MICRQRRGHSGSNNFQLFTSQGPGKKFLKHCDKCRARLKQNRQKPRASKQDKARRAATLAAKRAATLAAKRAATLAANIAYEQQNVPGVSFPTCLHFYI